jgi:toxin ParE1/3/4
MARVLLRPRAKRDLDQIGDYIAERGGDDRADRMLDRIAQAMHRIADHPLTGRTRDELQSGLRSVPIQSYIIFYVPLPDGIRVVRVLHGARDSSSIFEDETDDE